MQSDSFFIALLIIFGIGQVLRNFQNETMSNFDIIWECDGTYSYTLFNLNIIKKIIMNEWLLPFIDCVTTSLSFVFYLITIFFESIFSIVFNFIQIVIDIFLITINFIIIG
jgi:hypothetical protein